MISRREAIDKIMEHVTYNDMVLSTTGLISREVFATNDRPGNFYMIGSMGLLSSFALGLALLVSEHRMFVIEGDGSALMSLGCLPLIAAEKPKNLFHVILDNEAYESTGAQPSVSSKFGLDAVAEGCRYHHVSRVDEPRSLNEALLRCGADSGPQLILVKVRMAPTQGIVRVSRSPTEIRDGFREHIRTVSARPRKISEEGATLEDTP